MISVLVFFVIGLPASMLIFSKGNCKVNILTLLTLTSITGPLIVNYIVFILGYARALTRENVFLFSLIAFLFPLLLKRVRLSLKSICVNVFQEIKTAAGFFEKLSLPEKLALSIVVTILAITSYSAFTRVPVLRDPYAVWLFYGKKIMETRTIPLFYGNAPDISWSGNYPPLISFLAGYYFIILGETIPEAFTHVSWLYGVLTLLATYLLARELGLGKASIISMFLLTTSSLFTLELINYGYVTVAWAFYVVSTCFFFVKYLHEKTSSALLAFVLSLAASLLSTYLSLIFALLLTFLILIHALVIETRKKRIFPEHKKLVIGLLISFSIASPWFIRNYVLLQNPFYPWFYQLFGGKGIDPAIIEMIPQAKYTLQKLLTDQTFSDPANQDLGYTLLIFGLMGAAYLIKFKNKLSTVYMGVLTLSFFSTLFVSMNLHYGYERYFLMAAPLLAISAAYLLRKIFSFSGMHVLKTLTLISIFIFSLPNYVYLISLMPYGAPAGEITPLNYIESYIDNYVPSGSVILTNEIQLYFINRQTINLYNLPSIFQAKNLTELITSLKLHNVTHILINDTIDPEVLTKTVLEPALTERPDIFVTLLKICPYTLYRINYGEGA